MGVKQILKVSVLSLAVLEIVSRLALLAIFQVPFFQPMQLHQNFYPELEKLQQYRYDEEKTNLLILAGSVLYGDTLTVELNGEPVRAYFCDPSKLLPADKFNVVNLAEPAHNSLDSWYKYKFSKAKFDAVFVYHGINDTRANNIARKSFDERYRHIEFYDDLYIIHRHPEFRILTFPLVIDWVVHSVAKRKRTYIPRELFHGLLSGNPEEYVLEGADIKTDKTFRRNLEQIIDRAGSRGESVILSSYAWYLPDNYNLDSFKMQRLDYGQQIFGTELYGLPVNVRKGLKSHNEIVKDLAGSHNTAYVDLDGILPKNAAYFDDICHITAAACSILSRELEKTLEQMPDRTGTLSLE